MFIELGIGGALMYGYKRWTDRDVYFIKKEIKNILIDREMDFYTIMNVNRTLPWGYSAIINLNGKGFSNLESIIDNIETKLGCETYIEQNKNLKTATIKIIVSPIDENTKFEPVKTKPYEVYFGLNYIVDELIVNLEKYPHILVSGQTGCGKTELIRLILANLINNFTDRDINIYFSDLSDMCDYSIFEKCKQVKGYAKNIGEAEKLFEYLMHIYTKRLGVFEKNGCKNIQEYNKKFYGKRMSYNYIVMDEMADYFPTSKLEKDYEKKVICYNLLKHMARKFRKVGMFLVIGIQRPDTTVLDPNLKSNLCTKIGFSQNSDASSLVVCDTAELTNIENRKAMLMYGNKREWFKTLFINDEVILEYVKSSIVNGIREKLDDYNKFQPKRKSFTQNIKKELNIQNNSIKEIDIKEIDIKELIKEETSPKPKTRAKVKINAK